MSTEERYNTYCRMHLDINEHLPTLRFLASLCSSVVECGVREAVSSYAFAMGLPAHGTLVMVDPYKSSTIDTFLQQEPRARFVEESDLTCPLVETDMLFIDTWHVYGQLKRELSRWKDHVRKYIVIHDTEVDGIHGETIRMGYDANKQSVESGIPIHEILNGLTPALEEFLKNNPEWTIGAQYYNNNGLTILVRQV
jgi:hypothetical protein